MKSARALESHPHYGASDSKMPGQIYTFHASSFSGESFARPPVTRLENNLEALLRLRFSPKNHSLTTRFLAAYVP
jgi:hypothetical protein